MKNNSRLRRAGRKPKSSRAVEHHEEEGRLHLRFGLAGEKYAIPIDFIQEILKPKNVTEIPHTPEYLSGIVNLRGKIVPVVDLRIRLELPRGEVTKPSRIIVISGRDQFIGLLVDYVDEVCPIQAKKIEPVSPIISGPVNTDYFEGIANLGDDIVAILDLNKVLRKPGANGASRAQAEPAGQNT